MRLIKPKVLYYRQNEVNFGKFSVEPLEKGVGHTIGRLIEGYILKLYATLMPSAFKFSHHEIKSWIDSIPEIEESADEILANIKKLVPISDGEVDEAIASIEVSGKKEVKAGDLKISGVKFENPDITLFHVKGKKKIKFELLLLKRNGFYFAEDFEKEKGYKKGFTYFDVSFSPVSSISYKVTNARVGQSINYDGLHIELHTKPGYYPEVLVQNVVRELKDNFNMLEKALPDKILEFSLENVESKKENPNLNIAINDLELTMRCRNCLKQIDVKTLGDLVKYSENDLMKISNFGKKSLDELKEVLAKYNLKFKESD